jgi:hypothetical protein
MFFALYALYKFKKDCFNAFLQCDYSLFLISRLWKDTP